MKKIYKILMLFFMTFFYLIDFSPMANLSYALTNNFEITESSNIESDLQQLKINIKKYKLDTTIYDIELISLAETKDNKLIVYTYEQSLNKNENETNLKSINISKTIDETVKFQNYTLTLLSQYQYNSDSLITGRFTKLIVNDFEISTDTVRYYEISSIFSNLDSNGVILSGDITEKSYKVASKFKFETLPDGTISVYFEGSKTITITDKYCGYVRYEDGFSLFPTSCDSHFVAFSADIQIDNLFEADVYFSTETYNKRKPNAGTEKTTYGEKETHNVSLKNSDSTTYKGNGWFSIKYEWNRIETKDNFVKNVESSKVHNSGIVGADTTINAEPMKNLENKQWVLRFYETDYSIEKHITSTGLQGSYTLEKGTLVGDITILRLKFETDGITYNLGVVDDKTNEDKGPINNTENIVFPGVTNWFERLIDNLKNLFTNKKLLILILVIILIVVLFPILPTILKLFSILIKIILKIIIFPIRLIFDLINRRKQ